VRAGKYSVEGGQHLNEDTLCLLESVLDADLEDEVIISVSEALSFLDEPKASVQDKFLETLMFAAVCDGHGGGGCSAYLQHNLARKVLQSIKLQQTRNIDNLGRVLVEAFKAAEGEFIVEEALNKGDNSGSCCVVSVISGREVVVAHVGDCRAVIFCNGSVIELTKDHRAVDAKELARITNAGGFVKNGRVNGVLAPSRSFGDHDIKRLNPEGVLIVEPEIVSFSVSSSFAMPNSTFMILASDGVWDVLSSASACEFVAKHLAKTGNPDLAALKLCEACSKHNKDDISAIVIVWNAVQPTRDDGALSPVLSPQALRKKYISASKLVG